MPDVTFTFILFLGFFNSVLNQYIIITLQKAVLMSIAGANKLQVIPDPLNFLTLLFFILIDRGGNNSFVLSKVIKEFFNNSPYTE